MTSVPLTTREKVIPGDTVSLVTFRHGVSQWWGVTMRWGNVIQKIMFSSKDRAEVYLNKHGAKKPRGGWKWTDSDNDLYDRYMKG